MRTADQLEPTSHGTSVTTAVRNAFDAIDHLDPSVQAWVSVDRPRAMATATELKTLRVDERLPLRGIPIGVKDIIDVSGMVTTSGAGSFAHRLPQDDASIVRKLREAGAVIIGKTATTEFAYMDPAPTRNPWNLEHTPGGSSSGSAAAVAAGMVPVAIGTQTVGSVLRPAAYCGVVGYKPSYGWVSTDGIAPLAWSFDHVGIFARSVAEIAQVFEAVSGTSSNGQRQGAIRLGVLRSFFAERMQSPALVHFDEVVTRVRRELGHLDEMPFRSRDEWFRPGMMVLAAEAAAYHQGGFPGHEDDYRPHFSALLRRGREIAATEYIQAKRLLVDLREQVIDLMEPYDALLLPVAPGPAPEGLASTGDSSFCAPASWTGLPSIALPSGLSEGGLPLALQLVGRPGADAALLSLALRFEALLEFSTLTSGPPQDHLKNRE